MKKRKLDWHATKFEQRGKNWKAATGYQFHSKLMGDLQVAAYDKALRVYARGKLADLGCGNAPLYGIYRPLVDEAVWVDWPSSPHQLFQLDLEHDLNQPIPIESDSFDTIILSDVLEHIAEPKALMAEISRLLRPSGVALIGVPFLYWIHEEPHDYHRYTRYQLAYLTEHSGLSVVEISEVGGAFDVWADLTAKLVGSVWSPLAAIPHFAWTAARSIPAVRRINDKAAWRFPLAYLAVVQKRA